MRIKNSFLFRLSALFLVLICTPILLITLVTAVHLRTITSHNLQELNESNIAAASKSLEFQFEQYARITDSIVLSGEVQKIAKSVPEDAYSQLLSNRAFSETVQNFLVQNYEINAAYLFTADGAVYQSGNTDNYFAFVQPEAQAYLSKAGAGTRDAVLYRGAFVPAFRSAEHEVYLPMVLRPLFHSYNRRLLGVIVLELDPALYRTALDFSEEPTFVLTDDGRVIFSSAGVAPGTRADTLFGGTTPETHALVSWDGAEYSVSASSGNYGFSLMQLRDYSALTHSIYQALVPLLIAAMLFAVFSLALALLLSRRMVQPLRALQTSLQAMENGDLSHKVEILSQDEVGQLAGSFNKMLDRLNLYIETAYREKLNTLDAEFRALQAQINPHFLYNSLESINSLALIHHQDEISEMVCALADMFRYVTEQRDPIVTVQSELVHVHNYLTLQSIGFDNKTEVTVEVGEAVCKCRIPKMTLQPLLENCFNHAKTSGQPLRIKVEGKHADGWISLTVRDNGCGIPAGKLEALHTALVEPALCGKIQENRTSIGLLNISERLRLFSDGRAQLQIDSREGEGTAVTLRLPDTAE